MIPNEGFMYGQALIDNQVSPLGLERSVNPFEVHSRGSLMKFHSTSSSVLEVHSLSGPLGALPIFLIPLFLLPHLI